MKNKKLIVSIVALAVIVALMAGIYIATRPATTAGTKTITVTVVHADDSTKEFTYTTNAEFLADVLLAEGLVAGDDTEYGLTIHTVDGEKADWNENQSYWALYIGTEYATTGASSTPVNDGDSFTLEYTIG